MVLTRDLSWLMMLKEITVVYSESCKIRKYTPWVNQALMTVKVGGTYSYRGIYAARNSGRATGRGHGEGNGSPLVTDTSQ